MAGSPLTSIRSNSMPAAGVTSLQSVAPEQVPAEIAALVSELNSVITRFREASADMSISLDQAIYKAPGDSKSVRITSVGLGYRIRSHHQAILNVSNSAGAASVLQVSPYFPHNLIAGTNIQINGGTSVYSASGKAGLAVYGRTKRGFFTPFNNGLSPAICRVTWGAGITATASALFSFSGVSSISVAAGTVNAAVTADFYTFEKVAYSRDSLLGALPLQNNSVYAQLTRQLVGSLTGVDQTAPFYVVAGFPVTTTVTINSFTTDSKYDFWSVPSDPGLYAPMVNNSYQVQEAANLTAGATGANALKYDIPTNQFLVATHLFAVDRNNAPLGWADLSKRQLMYNGGSIIPVVQDAGTTRADQYAVYGADLGAIPGYNLWDGDATTDQITDTDEAGWVDAYHAATPQLVSDVAANVQAPITYSVTREIIVAGAVQTVG